VQNSKLIYFLGKLGDEGRQRFAEFVAARYFNPKKSLELLLEYLVGSFLGAPPYPTDEEVYWAVFGKAGGKIKLATLRTSISELMGLLQRFLALQKFERDEPAQNLALLHALIELEDTKYFPVFLERAQEELSATQLDSWDRFHHALRLVEAQHEYWLRQPGRQANANLLNGYHYLNQGYMLRFLRYQLHVLSGSVSFEGYAAWDFAPTLAFVRQLADTYAVLPLIIRLYLLLLEAYSSPAVFGEFESLVEVAKIVASETSPNEYHDIYTLVINFAAQKINEGDVDAMPTTLAYYQFLLDRSLLAEAGKISAWHFKNLVNLAVRQGQFERALQFIQDWHSRVAPDFENNAFDFNMGVLKFHQKDFVEASRHFNAVLRSYQDVFYGLNARCYLLQAHYELGDLKSIDSQAHSLRMFLDRQEGISDGKRKQYIDFLNQLKRLCNLPPQDQRRRSKLRQEILDRKTKGLGRAWLLEKLDALD
jgi:tetratricopeptide (TPR) repeat protein